MKSIMEWLEEYLESSGLELNEEKTKVMRFRKGEGGKKVSNGDGREDA